MVEAKGASKFQQVNDLRDRLAKLSTGTTKLISMVGMPLMTNAFFPGANGLIDGESAEEFPVGKTLILGSNFGGEDKFWDGQGNLICLPNETTDPNNATWKGLRSRMTSDELRNAFFTNAWPFLHPGSSNLGKIEPWLRDKTLMKSCLDFFNFTIETVRPSLIVALGKGPAAFLSYVWPSELCPWRGYSWRHIDEAPLATVRRDEESIVCVAITHPSMSNSKHRSEPYSGKLGEKQLLDEARSMAKEIAAQAMFGSKGE